MKTNDQLIDVGREVLEIETSALAALAGRLDDSFAEAVRLLRDCRGRVVVTGMGKSGHIAHKVAATLASTGTPAFFMHPGEAAHGDLGMVTAVDVVLAFSNSGRTTELLALLEPLSALGAPLIAIVGDEASPLARAATVTLEVTVEREACPLNLAPTTSTTAALALGDALAVALMELKQFKADDFARFHPGGRLGQRLRSLSVAELLISGDDFPVVGDDAAFDAVVTELATKRQGIVVVTAADGALAGVVSNGDVLRMLAAGRTAGLTARRMLNPKPKTITPAASAEDAVALMETHNITALVVVDDGRPLGLIHLHDALGRRQFWTRKA
jgi:arabinose-5-phosphate isomerase